MSHDLVAELDGYRNELARYAMHGPAERADQVREQITRVRGEISDRIGELEAEAAEHADAGRDGLAGECAVAARPLTKALEDSGDLAGRTPAKPGKENAAESKPRTTAGRGKTTA